MRHYLSYALPAIPLAFLGLPFYVVVPSVYAEYSSASLAAISLALFLARLFDVVSDPIAGWLSDRWPGGASRRGPMWLGAPFLLLGVWFVFQPPIDASVTYLFFWTLVTYVGWTLINVPYQTWAADLGDNQRQRNQFNASRETGTLIGTVCAMLTLGLYANDNLHGLSHMAWLLMLALPLALSASFLLCSQYHNPMTPSRLRNIPGLLKRYPNLRRLILAYGINALANGIPATLFLLYVGHVLALEQQAPLLLAVYFISGLLGVPFWLWASRRWGKKHTWLASLVVASACFLLVLLLGSGDFWGFLAVCTLTGWCLGADLFLPASIQSDIARQLEEQEQRALSGMLFGLWGIATKTALALAVVFTFLPLHWAGFDASQVNDDTALLTLTLLYGCLPVLLKAIAISRLLPITLPTETESAHDQVDDDLDRPAQPEWMR